MPNQIQVELEGKTINLTVSDDQMSIVSDDGREFKAMPHNPRVSGCKDVCSFIDLRCCRSIPCMPKLRDSGDDVYFIELT